MVREEFLILAFAYSLVWFYGQTDTSHEYLYITHREHFERHH